MPKLDLDAIAQINATGYPSPYREAMAKRHYRKLAGLAGIPDFGISHVVLEPGGISSQRHWHEGEDELLVMLTGHAVLVEDDGETELGPGDIAVWPKGVRNGHHLINRTSEPCSFVCVSAGVEAGGAYSDIDMMWTVDGSFVHKDGTPYGDARTLSSSS